MNSMALKVRARALVLFSLLILCTLSSGIASADIPQLINYQGYLTDKNGVPINGSVSVVFSLYPVSQGGSARWTESQVVTLAKGLYSVILGGITPLTPDVFSGSSLYLGVKVGQDAEMLPRQQLTSVGYAFRAAEAESIADKAVTAQKIGENCNVGEVLVKTVAGWQCGRVTGFINGGGTCVGNVCSMNCISGFIDCDAAIDNGCETNGTTDPANCGACGRVCSYANASGLCATGACTMGACLSGFGNCNNVSSDGCETNINTSVTNCGACGRVCAAVANGTGSCVAGACNIAACNAGFGNCDAMTANGCEINLYTSATNCGACGRVCAAVANGTGSCVAGACNIAACNAGFGNCDGMTANGCEINLNTSVTNCGACGRVCANVANGTASCISGVCGIACNTGFGNCDAMTANGCETNINTSVTNCGRCGTRCAAGYQCINGVCIL